MGWNAVSGWRNEKHHISSWVIGENMFFDISLTLTLFPPCLLFSDVEYVGERTLCLWKCLSILKQLITSVRYFVTLTFYFTKTIISIMTQQHRRHIKSCSNKSIGAHKYKGHIFSRNPRTPRRPLVPPLVFLPVFTLSHLLFHWLQKNPSRFPSSITEKCDGRNVCRDIYTITVSHSHLHYQKEQTTGSLQ